MVGRLSENGCKINKFNLCLAFSAKNQLQIIELKVKIRPSYFQSNFILLKQFFSEDLAAGVLK
jgi:hypothetical protein